MNDIRIRLADIVKNTIPIGYEGEENHTKVTFYCSAVFDEYPDAVATMAIKPAVGDAYPQTVTQENGLVVWDVTPANVAGAGSGTFQFTFTDGEEIIKSVIGSYTVSASIIGSGEMPDPVADWVTEANAALAAIPNTISEAIDDALEEAKESGDFKGDPGEPGAKGDPGDPAPASAVAAAVDDYLEENFSNPSNPPLDRSLTSSLSAAPADLVGNLKNEINGKISEPANEGTSGQVLTTDGNGVRSWTTVQGGGGGGTVDTDMSKTSTNPVQNNVITKNTCTEIPVPSVVTGKYVNKNGGDNSSGSYSETAYIPYVYNIGAYITLNCTIYDTVSFAFYDSDKRTIRVITGSNASDYGITTSRSVQRVTLEVPTGTAFFRASYLGTATTSSFNIITGYNGIDASLQNAFYELIAASESEQISYTGTNKKQLTNGAVESNNDSTYYVTNDIEIEPSTYYILSASAGYGHSFYAFVDSNSNVIVYFNSGSGSVAPIISRVIYTPANAKYIRIAYVSTVCQARLNKITSISANTKKEYGWENKFLNISYSDLNVATINTLETYISAGHFGFNVCKGDVETTSDSKLIMCHDPGFSFDSNDRIKTFNESSNTPIASLTYAQCMALEYAGKAGASENNHYQKVCDIDQYLDVCKQYGMIAFITIRTGITSTAINELFDALKRHYMLDHCIINSYDATALQDVRNKNKDIPLSSVQATNNTITKKKINFAKSLGNCAVTFVSTPEDMRTYIANHETIIDLAHENNVGLMYAQPLTMEDVTWLRNNGFCGAQIGRTILPYTFEQVRFKINISSGTATLSEWNDLNTMEATVSQSGNVISVSEFTIAGSERGFPDLIMDVWMNKFPYRITATSENGNSVTASWQNNALKLTVSDISVNDTIDVMIEV